MHKFSFNKYIKLFWWPYVSHACSLSYCCCNPEQWQLLTLFSTIIYIAFGGATRSDTMWCLNNIMLPCFKENINLLNHFIWICNTTQIGIHLVPQNNQNFNFSVWVDFIFSIFLLCFLSLLKKWKKEMKILFLLPTTRDCK